jgi:hypothetical protein
VVLRCYGRVRVHAQHSYPVYQLDGYTHSSQSDVNSVSSMIEYIKLDRFWRVNAKKWCEWQRPDPCIAHNMVEVKGLKILKQANRAVRYVILGNQGG